MFVKLDTAVRKILCCPMCKGELQGTDSHFACLSCGIVYPLRTVGKSKNRENVFDFRICPPAYCKSADMAKWSDIQKEFVRGDVRRNRKDELERYLEAIDSIREIYTDEFRIKGSVLDVGGHHGRLRHFLSASEVSLYLSVDPYLNVFDAIGSCPKLLKAYPCLSEPCNFVACHGENLPLRGNTFDWVHIQSVLDHVYDAYRVMTEAYRVLKANGMVLIGLAVTGGRSTLEADRREKPTYVSPFVPKVLRFLKSLGMIRGAKYKLKVFSAKPLDDGHICRWKYENLLDLLQTTNFAITKEHWQKPPYTACIYIAAKKQSLDC